MKGAIFIARKNKVVKEKKIAFDLDEWEIVKRRAAECNTNTTAFIRQMAVREPALFYDAKELAPLFNGMRIISRNINQVAKKANETNCIYAADVEKLREEVERLCSMSSMSVFTAPYKII